MRPEQSIHPASLVGVGIFLGFCLFFPVLTVNKYQFQDIMGGHIIIVYATNYTDALMEARQVLTSPRLYKQ